mgnify:CR=1 FL=1
MRVRVGRVGGRFLIIISMSRREFVEVRRGALLAYKCLGDYTDRPLARYVWEVLEYLKGIESCSKA